MSPKDYIKARQDSLGYLASSSQHDEEQYNNATKNGSYVAWISGRPYVPEMIVATMDDAKRVAAHIMELTVVSLLANKQEANEGQAEGFGKIIDHKALTVTPVAGGRTNTLYLVEGFRDASSSASSSSSLPDDVLVRVFGAEGMIDRDTENAAYAALSAAGLAPPYYGRFANGRLEGWMRGMRALLRHELPHAAPGIATQLARLHTQFQLPPATLATTTSTTAMSTTIGQPNVFVDLDQWMEQALQSKPSGNPETVSDVSVQQQQQLESLQLNEKVRPELDWLKEQVTAVLSETASPASICFCHNDVLASNILIADEQNGTEPNSNDNIQLIDFEYGGINYRAFDIANHFNEYAGGPPDLAVPEYELRPSREQQRAFVQTYLETATVAGENGGNNVATTDVDALMREVQIFLLVNHLYWGLWAVNQAVSEGCAEYDYMMYAVNRIRQYWIDKKEQQQQQQYEQL